MAASPTDEPARPRAVNDDEMLVAYLDGELDLAQTVELESRLSADELLRARMKEFQQTWDMLDSLPDVPTAQSLSRSTIEMVARQATRELQARQKAWMRWSRRGLATVVLLALPALLGFQTVRYVQRSGERQLIRDLRVIENVELYRSFDTLDFLIQLHESGVFAKEEGRAP